MGQNKQPTHGTKVDLGKDAPVTEEGPGNVKSGSLAAESTKEGGGFSENKDVHIKDGKSNTKDTSSEFSSKNTSSENTSRNTSSEHSQSKSSENFSSKSTENTSKSSSGSENTAKSSRGGLSNETQGGSAPTYVESQYAHDHNGPHGKNLHEGIDEADLRKAKRADPIAAAENQFVQTELGEPGQKPFQAGEKTAFDALGDTQA